MKKYNEFKLMYFDDDFVNEKPITLTIEGDYLVGTLPHLSLYSLNGNYNETVPDTPKTYDSINTWYMLLTISIISVGGTIIVYKKKFN